MKVLPDIVKTISVYSNPQDTENITVTAEMELQER